MARQRLTKTPVSKSSSAIAPSQAQKTPQWIDRPQATKKPDNPNFSGLSHELSFPLQAKLTIGEPNDKYEQEADKVANQVVKQIQSPQISASQGDHLQRQAETGEGVSSITPLKFSTLQRKGDRQPSSHAAGLETSINQARGTGQKLPNSLRPKMEQAFSHDLSRVRIHDSPNADRLNHSIRAKAFTTGQDIFFRKGEYQPNSPAGQTLLAHELTHVVQQKGQSSRIQTKGDPVEKTVTQNRDEDVELLHLETIIRIMNEKIAHVQQIITGTDNTGYQARGQELLDMITGGVGRDTKHWGETTTMTLGQALNAWSKDWGIARTGGLLADLSLRYKGIGPLLDIIIGAISEGQDQSSIYDPDATASAFPRQGPLAEGRKSKNMFGMPQYNKKSDWSKKLPKHTKKNAGPSATTAHVIGMLCAHGIDHDALEAAMYALQQFWEVKRKKRFEYAYHTAAEVWGPYNQYLFDKAPKG